MSDIYKLLAEIKNNRDFSAQQKAVAAYVAENYFMIPFLSISSLSEKIGVSDATVVKFCQKLGYTRFKDFKNALSECAHSELTMSNKLIANSSSQKSPAMTEELNDAVASISATLSDRNNAEALSRTVEAINRAEHIYIMGARSSAYFAGLLATMLRYLDLKVYDVSFGNGDLIDKASMISEKDFVIAISLPRYTAHIVDVLRILHERSVPIALLTDTGLSPAYKYSDIAFNCSVTSSYYFPCTAGLSAIISAICRAVSRDRKDKASSHIMALEQSLLREKVFL